MPTRIHIGGDLEEIKTVVEVIESFDTVYNLWKNAPGEVGVFRRYESRESDPRVAIALKYITHAEPMRPRI